MNDIQALREFQNCGAVVTINRILDTKRNEMSEDNVNWAINKLIQFSHSAMAKAGIKADENGQYEFADCIFFDMQMSDELKIYWLEMCDGQEERIGALKAEANQ